LRFPSAKLGAFAEVGHADRRIDVGTKSAKEAFRQIKLNDALTAGVCADNDAGRAGSIGTVRLPW
jgi:hypothetical protein